MAIQFPDAPFQGQSFVASNGVSYTYDNGGWIANSQSGLDDRYVNLNGDSMTGDLTVPSLNGGQLAGFRNQIQNPFFNIRQRGDSFTSPSDIYTFDRWWIGNAAGRTVAHVQESQFMSAMLITNNTSDNVFLRQGIEIPKGSSGQFVQGSVWTLSLWSDSTGWVGRSLGACAFRDAGLMNNSIGQVALSTGSFAATGETNGAYTRFSLRIDIDALPTENHEMLCIGLSLPSGGQRITGIQLEPGPVATPMEHRPIQTELALCQRYYAASSVRQDAFKFDSGNGTFTTTRLFPVTMRVLPTVDTAVTGFATSSVQVQGTDGFWLQGTGGGFPRLDSYTADAEL